MDKVNLTNDEQFQIMKQIKEFFDLNNINDEVILKKDDLHQLLLKWVEFHSAKNPILNNEECNIVNLYRTNFRAIWWGVEDFEYQASIIEKTYDHIRYDRTKFLFALEEMIRSHDAVFGITWETVCAFLNDYCRIE